MACCGIFGRARDPSISDAPSDAMMCAKAESHFGGVVDDNRSCKIFGRAMVWLTPTDLVVKSVAGGTFTWKCARRRRLRPWPPPPATRHAPPLMLPPRRLHGLSASGAHPRASRALAVQDRAADTVQSDGRIRARGVCD